jgi:ATP-dependent Clp protease ATP-binding subunit ClpA
MYSNVPPFFGPGRAQVSTARQGGFFVSNERTARARINSLTRPPDVKELEKQIETISAEKEAAIKAQDYEKAATLRDFEKLTKDKHMALRHT